MLIADFPNSTDASSDEEALHLAIARSRYTAIQDGHYEELSSSSSEDAELPSIERPSNRRNSKRQSKLFIIAIEN